ncbi:hypothetical protein J2X19_003951 [Rhodoferax ferrireducens]|uniref:Uncharacterized protein n=1 Tax=Rhodoferax ferrireducens TaxID=192843 RepID=A0ABU2CD39_9BURK|nr:hypothetical protein [Rhodoferax ferrireducens]
MNISKTIGIASTQPLRPMTVKTAKKSDIPAALN